MHLLIRNSCLNRLIRVDDVVERNAKLLFFAHLTYMLTLKEVPLRQNISLRLRLRVMMSEEI